MTVRARVRARTEPFPVDDTWCATRDQGAARCIS
jgi:hypothetical protein